jgi:hypothetical protein
MVWALLTSSLFSVDGGGLLFWEYAMVVKKSAIKNFTTEEHRVDTEGRRENFSV